MRPAFIARLALREGRRALDRIGVFMASITLGVGALVTIHSFKSDVTRSVRDEAQSLLGADVRLSANRPFPDSITRIVDSLTQAGARAASVTTALTMVTAPRTDAIRLLQLRGIEGDYPFYGRVSTLPAESWGALREPGKVLVDPGVLTQLGIGVGDSLLIGNARFAVAATVEDLPTDLGLRTAVGPRVHLSRRGLESAGLLGFGSLARYELFLTMPDEGEQGALRERYDAVFDWTGVRFTTAEAEAGDLTEAVDWLGRYLGLVGLAALLLGGVGVASAVHVFVKERLSTVAVLRCLGARQGDVFLAYLLQIAALGLLGSAAGALLGVLAQSALPRLLAGVLPVDVATSPKPGSALAGVAVGSWVAVLFALAPLLTVRDVPPLSALRRDFEPARRLDWTRAAVWAGLLATVVVLAMREAPEPDEGLVFAGGVAAAAVLLWLTAWLLMAVTRAVFPARAPYPLRQGVANLFRPRNQTVPVTLALGFGAFVVGTVLQVQSAIGRELDVGAESERPNLILFDVQPDQTAGVLALLPGFLADAVEVAPLVPARIARLNGRAVGELLSDTTDEGPDRWALRREYRNTFRDRLTESEELVAGRWFDALPPRAPGAPARVSVEADLAEALDVVVGDTVVWDVAGLEIPSVVSSLRFVDWGQFTTNFFVVFEPGVLEEAPYTDVVLARVPDAKGRALLQRQLVGTYPNVSVLDVERVQEALGAILGKVDRAVRFLAGACALAGLLVLVGALSTSRYQRVREGALLRTLGAQRRHVAGMLLTEYAALGTVATLAGLLLAVGASAWVVAETLDLDYAVDLPSLLQVWMGVTALTVGMGGLASRPVLRRPPLQVLRETAE